MTAYRVHYRYKAWCNGERFDWQPGQVVDLSPAQADWANRDCAGVLSLVEPEPEPVRVVELVTPDGPQDVTEFVAGDATPVADEADTEQSEPDPVDAGVESTAEPEPLRRRAGRPRKPR